MLMLGNRLVRVLELELELELVGFGKSVREQTDASIISIRFWLQINGASAGLMV